MQGNSSVVATIDDLDQGAILAAKYRIVRILGRGGMGVVVEAEHVQLDERVAIKFLSADHLQNKEARERFAREARAVGRLRSQHVARVRDVGELSTGQPYIVMELMVGRDLAQTLLDLEMSTGHVVDLMLQACEALAEAHAGGIVHRDVKPANMFITHTIDGLPLLKLLDFGVASSPAGDAQITSSGVIVGTPAYMCPEQMRSSRQAEPRWDIWSLGVVLYSALERRLPFAGEGFAELAVSVLTEDPKPMVRTPSALAAVVMRCLDKDPDARFQDVAEVVAALAPFAATPEQAETSIRRTTRILRGSGPTRIASEVSSVGSDRISVQPATVGLGTPSRAASPRNPGERRAAARARARCPRGADGGPCSLPPASSASRSHSWRCAAIRPRRDRPSTPGAWPCRSTPGRRSPMRQSPMRRSPMRRSAMRRLMRPSTTRSTSLPRSDRDPGPRTKPRDPGRKRVAPDASPPDAGTDPGELTPEEQMKGRN